MYVLKFLDDLDFPTSPTTQPSVDTQTTVQLANSDEALR